MISIKKTKQTYEELLAEFANRIPGTGSQQGSSSDGTNLTVHDVLPKKASNIPEQSEDVLPKRITYTSEQIYDVRNRISEQIDGRKIGSDLKLQNHVQFGNSDSFVMRNTVSSIAELNRRCSQEDIQEQDEPVDICDKMQDSLHLSNASKDSNSQAKLTVSSLFDIASQCGGSVSVDEMGLSRPAINSLPTTPIRTNSSFTTPVRHPYGILTESQPMPISPMNIALPHSIHSIDNSPVNSILSNSLPNSDVYNANNSTPSKFSTIPTNSFNNQPKVFTAEELRSFNPNLSSSLPHVSNVQRGMNVPMSSNAPFLPNDFTNRQQQFSSGIMPSNMINQQRMNPVNYHNFAHQVQESPNLYPSNSPQVLPPPGFCMMPLSNTSNIQNFQQIGSSGLPFVHNSMQQSGAMKNTLHSMQLNTINMMDKLRLEQYLGNNLNQVQNLGNNSNHVQNSLPGNNSNQVQNSFPDYNNLMQQNVNPNQFQQNLNQLQQNLNPNQLQQNHQQQQSSGNVHFHPPIGDQPQREK